MCDLAEKSGGYTIHGILVLLEDFADLSMMSLGRFDLDFVGVLKLGLVLIQ